MPRTSKRTSQVSLVDRSQVSVSIAILDCTGVTYAVELVGVGSIAT